MADYKVQNKMLHWQKSYPSWVSALAIFCLLGLWEAVCRSGFVSALFLPAPSGILSSLLTMTMNGEIGRSLAASMARIATGFVVGSIIGLIVAIAAIGALCYLLFRKNKYDDNKLTISTTASKSKATK